MEQKKSGSKLLTGTAIGLAAGAAAGVTAAWISQAHQPGSIPIGTSILALCLLAALSASNQFPIHIRVSSKVYMGSVVLFLMAVLLPPALAATVAGLGCVVAELSSRHHTGNPWHVIVSQASRWILLVLAASCVANISGFDQNASAIPLIAAAAVLWVGDMLSFLLIYHPVTGEKPWRILRDMVVDGGIVEASQYLVGLLGALEVSRGAWTLALLFLPLGLVYMAFKNTKEMHDETRRILENMADTVDLRDPYTGGHSRRVTELTAAILRQMGKHGPDVKLAVSAARVHDIGKIGMPDEILLKEGRLSEEEWTVMRLHPEKGAELLQRYPDFSRGVEIIRHHHERWDGAGYPHRLAGNEIPFGSRVIAVADSYDAMTSDRPYRQGMSPDLAATILREGRGSQWDPQIVDAFLKAIANRLTQETRPRLHMLKPASVEETLTGTA